MKVFEKAQSIQPGTVTTEVPAREANVKADVLVPLLQALLTGGFVASLFVLMLNEVPNYDGDLLKIWGAVTLLIAAIAWLVLLGQHRKLLWAIETFRNTDLDGDGQVGPPIEVQRAADYKLTQGGQQVLPKTAEPERLITIHPEQGNLVWFALYVIRCQDLAVGTLEIKPAPRLPFEEPDRRGRPRKLYLRKSMITKLLKRGAKIGWWAGPDPGAPAHFTHPRQVVKQQALAMWCEVMQDTPPPDYWSDGEYKTFREE